MNSDDTPPHQAYEDAELRNALTALEALLERRATELSDEVAHYPTPIAHCDEQLPKLIEQRGEFFKRLRSVRAIAQQEDANQARLESLEEFINGYGRPDDAEERALVSSIVSILGSTADAREAQTPDETTQ